MSFSVGSFRGAHRAAWSIIALSAFSLGDPLASNALAQAVAAPAAPAKAAPDTAKSSNDSVVRATQSLYGNVRQEVLPNGLRVYLKPIPGAATVTTMVAYQVGSADEELESTGLSHYLEHLMFKGTEKIKPGDIDKATLRNGGLNNAYTTEDHTIFHFDFASDRWQQALEIEADRMQNLRIDTQHEFEQEKGAVIEELRQNEDLPWDLERKLVLPPLFGADSPYGHPVIGQTEHVRGATAEIIKKHYDRWYHPNNAALVICGGFDPDQAMVRIKELFGPIPKVELPARNSLGKKKTERPAKVEMTSKFDAPRIMLAYNGVKRSDEDYYALEIVQGILTGGKTGRLYRKLVEDEQIASEVTSYNQGGRYPGYFAIEATLLPDVKLEQGEKSLLNALRQLATDGVTEGELQRVQKSALAHALFEREGVHELADNIAQSVVYGDLSFARDYLPGLLAVKPADVQRAVKKYLDPKQRVAVYSNPEATPKPEAKAGIELPGKTGPSASVPARSARNGQSAPRVSFRKLQKDEAAKSSTETAAEVLKKVRREVLPNGLTLLLLEDHRLPIVTIESYVRNTRLHEPADKAGVATLVGDLLDEGTAAMSGQEIAETIETLGGSMAFDQAGGILRILSADRHQGLDILLNCLIKADFPQDAFDRGVQQLLAELDEHEKQPESKGQLLYRSLAYGSHPFARSEVGKRETVEKLTREDCIAQHAKTFVPNNTLLAIVGDFDTAQVIEEVKQLTADWKKKELTTPKLPAVEKPKEFTQRIESLPQAAQVHLFLGHVGIRRDNPDYYKLEVMDYVLGSGPGFTDRLSSRLRDREGLAYAVGADITSSAVEEPGLFTCHIGLDPKNFTKVKTMLMEEMNRIVKEKPTEQEVEDAKRFLLGHLPFKISNSQHIAGELIEVERFKLGTNYLADYQKAIQAVTVDDVYEAAKKYIDPTRLILVASGPIDKDGKAIDKADKP